MSKLKEFDWIKIYIYSLISFYCVLSLFSFIGFTEIIMFSFLISMPLLGILSIIIFLSFNYLKNKKNLDINLEALESMQYFWILQGSFLYVSFMWAMESLNFRLLIRSVFL